MAFKFSNGKKEIVRQRDGETVYVDDRNVGAGKLRAKLAFKRLKANAYPNTEKGRLTRAHDSSYADAVRDMTAGKKWAKENPDKVAEYKEKHPLKK